MSLYKSQEIKLQSSLAGSMIPWGRGRRLLLSCLTSGRCFRRTWVGSDIKALSKHWSASPARAAANRADLGKKPLRLSLLISRSIRLRSCAEEKPHQEEDAYVTDATVVALATSCNCGGGRPWQRKTLRANMNFGILSFILIKLHCKKRLIHESPKIGTNFSS